ncbi:hypothetical protein T492DRAFT_1147068 [Pavlovales sp. CCMP2436]|nr:hypothetical protein T492DRAFT_1147068 [Pavlovales sp. CCMP2436]
MPRETRRLEGVPGAARHEGACAVRHEGAARLEGAARHEGVAQHEGAPDGALGAARPDDAAGGCRAEVCAGEGSCDGSRGAFGGAIRQGALLGQKGKKRSRQDADPNAPKMSANAWVAYHRDHHVKTRRRPYTTAAAARMTANYEAKEANTQAAKQRLELGSLPTKPA